jgi:serine/threonine protein phosphatase PrpC
MTVSDPMGLAGRQLRGAARTDPGRVRTNNEDVPILDPARGVFGVIDGVGGEAGGEVAAATAHDVIVQRLARPQGSAAERVREAIAIANNEIYKRSQESQGLRGMACVITLAIVADGRLTVGHVGDTRLYVLRAGSARKLTRDHSPVGEREDAGELGEVDAMRHPRRNEVFRDVGSAFRDKDEEDFVDVVEEPIGADTAILVCSDGLSDMLTAAAITHIVRQHAGDPQRVVDALVAAANAAGGKDNVTAVYAEGPLFAAAFGAGVQDALTPTEPLAAIPAGPPSGPLTGASSDRTVPAARPASVTRSRHRTSWFVAGTVTGILGALSLTWLMAITQVRPPQTLVVDGEGSAPFATIAAAMAAARPGDVVRVDPGTYLEQVTVADGVDLVAKEAGSVTIARPEGLALSSAGLVAGGTLPVRLSGIRVSSLSPFPAAVGVRVAGTSVRLELVEISGLVTAAIDVQPEASVTMYGSRVNVSGLIASVPDNAQATFTNNIFIRSAPAPEPALATSPLSRVTLSGNVFAGFTPEIVHGLAEARRTELLSGNFVVAPAPTPARRRFQDRVR